MEEEKKMTNNFTSETVKKDSKVSYSETNKPGLTSSYFLTVTSIDGNEIYSSIGNQTQTYTNPNSKLSSHLIPPEKFAYDLGISPLVKNLSAGGNLPAENIIKKRNDNFIRKRSIISNYSNSIQNSSSSGSINNSERNITLNNANFTNEECSLTRKCKYDPLLEISITGYIIKNVIIQHVKYIITLIKNMNNSENINPNENLDNINNPNKLNHPEQKIKLYRRYSEFVYLREILKNKYIGVFIPSLPLKEVFGNKDIALIEFRKKFLQIFMHELQICYFFNQSEEIKAFLDPEIDNFPPNNILIQTNMNKESDHILIIETLKNTKEKISNNYINHQIKFNADVFKINFRMPPLNPLIMNYKKIQPDKILSYIKKNKKFSAMLFNKKKFLENIQIVLCYLIKEEKEISNAKVNFLNELRNFQNNFIFAMNDNVINNDSISTPQEDNKQGLDSCLKKMENIFNEKKSFYKLLKNVNDWIYKEIINLESCIECINSLNPYIEKVKKVFSEINKLYKTSTAIHEKNEKEYEYINFEVKEKLETKYENLKEIIAINSLFINEVELTKYKTCRFVYFYNCLKFACIYNQTHYIDETFYSESLQKLILMMGMYLKTDIILNKSNDSFIKMISI